MRGCDERRMKGREKGEGRRRKEGQGLIGRERERKEKGKRRKEEKEETQNKTKKREKRAMRWGWDGRMDGRRKGWDGPIETYGNDMAYYKNKHIHIHACGHPLSFDMFACSALLLLLLLMLFWMDVHHSMSIQPYSTCSCPFLFASTMSPLRPFLFPSFPFLSACLHSPSCLFVVFHCHLLCLLETCMRGYVFVLFLLSSTCLHAMPVMPQNVHLN